MVFLRVIAMPAKTVSIHYPSGDPTEIRIAELSNRIIRAYSLPRSLLSKAREIDGLNKPALYVLLSQDGAQAYIGESENFLDRIGFHDADTKKDFTWDLALVFVTKDTSLEKSDVGYLESIAVARAKEARKAEIQNRTVPAKKNLHQFKISSVEEFFSDICFLSSALGFPIFDVLSKEEIKEKEIWYCKTNKTDARAVFEGSRFTLLAGSVIDTHHAESWAKYYPIELQERQQIFGKHGELHDDAVTLKENVTFKSPNHAGSFAAGRSVNAWTTWKNAAGKTMDEVLR